MSTLRCLLLFLAVCTVCSWQVTVGVSLCRHHQKMLQKLMVGFRLSSFCHKGAFGVLSQIVCANLYHRLSATTFITVLGCIHSTNTSTSVGGSSPNHGSPEGTHTPEADIAQPKPEVATEQVLKAFRRRALLVFFFSFSPWEQRKCYHT